MGGRKDTITVSMSRPPPIPIAAVNIDVKKLSATSPVADSMDSSGGISSIAWNILQPQWEGKTLVQAQVLASQGSYCNRRIKSSAGKREGQIRWITNTGNVPPNGSPTTDHVTRKHCCISALVRASGAGTLWARIRPGKVKET
jgi:hypothetical protein